MREKYTMNSTIKEIYAHPIGHDFISQLLLLLNKKESLITNPISSRITLKTIARLTKHKLSPDVFTTILRLLNQEQELPLHYDGDIPIKWWKEVIVYQIYPRSFYDTNGDGIGDLKGIIKKLDYLKDLGIDVVWLSPIYDSPNDDNGYDIRNYYKIMKEFGTLNDFENLLYELHKRDMKLIMDLVINHTSDEHEWFQSAIHDPNSPYRDYYHFRTGPDSTTPPNNWTSCFGGKAWNYYKERGEWGLHLFSKKQMDLNWTNESVRKDLYSMINWWLEKGIDGFRLDVINFISKEDGYPDGNKLIGDLIGFTGCEHYFYGPKLNEYLQEMRSKTFNNYDVFTIGETPGIGMEMAKLLTADHRNELDMIFSFNHLEMPGHLKYTSHNYNLNYLKKYYIQWMRYYGNDCWMSLFYENHDNPRMISKINSSPKYRNLISKLLATIQMTLRGTPFLYQGQELAAIDHRFNSIDQLQDIESRNMYTEFEKMLGKEKAFAKILNGTRDHARTPMQWDASPNGGFTKGTPWLQSDDDYLTYNVASESSDPKSVLNYFKSLITLRKSNDAFVYGDFNVENEKTKNLFTYTRSYGNKMFFIECNLSSAPIRKKKAHETKKLLLSNYDTPAKSLRAYEANIYVITLSQATKGSKDKVIALSKKG